MHVHVRVMRSRLPKTGKNGRTQRMTKKGALLCWLNPLCYIHMHLHADKLTILQKYPRKKWIGLYFDDFT